MKKRAYLLMLTAAAAAFEAVAFVLAAMLDNGRIWLNLGDDDEDTQDAKPRLRWKNEQ